MLLDSHAHLDESALQDFVQAISRSETEITIISNSINLESSLRNIELAKLSDNIIPFVGIHPDVFKQPSAGAGIRKAPLDTMIDNIRELAALSSGIGEIGLDPKYGSVTEQENLFRTMLTISESTGLPTSIHNRNSVSQILEILSTFDLKGSVLLHWFAGSEQELAQINDKGIFVSYGPSILSSKRMRSLVEKTRSDLLLPETDSPTLFTSLNHSVSTPFLIASVVFEMALIKNIPFTELKEKIWKNVLSYLGTQNSLRVKAK